MSPEVAAGLLSLRPALDALVVKVSEDPEYTMEPTEVDNEVIQLIKELCAINAGRYNLEQYSMSVFWCLTY